MEEKEWLADRFEQHRLRLRAVAYRMLGSLSEAEDAVQETWLRLSGAADAEVDDLGAWSTTVVARISLNILRSRKTRTKPLLPDPIIDHPAGPSPEHEALLSNTVGLALLVVLDSLSPPERVAFVLHDVFGLPFEEIAPVVDRTPDAARQLASRARRRIHARHPEPDADVAVQQSVVDAFNAASRDGDFQRLVAVLDPDVILRGQATECTLEVRGAHEVARRAHAFSLANRDIDRRSVLVNGAPGIVSLREGKPYSVLAFTVRGGKIVEIDILSDPERLALLDLVAALSAYELAR